MCINVLKTYQNRKRVCLNITYKLELKHLKTNPTLFYFNATLPSVIILKLHKIQKKNKLPCTKSNSEKPHKNEQNKHAEIEK